MGLTGEQTMKVVEEVVERVLKDWEKRIERQAEYVLRVDGEVRELRGRVQRLERILERIGKDALQERV